MNVKDILQYLGVAALGIFAYSFIRNLYSTQESIIEGMENTDRTQKIIDKIKGHTESLLSITDMYKKTYAPYKESLEDYLIAVDEYIPMAIFDKLMLNFDKPKGYKKDPLEEVNKIIELKTTITKAMELMDSQ